MLANSTLVRRINLVTIALTRLQAIYPRLSTFIWMSILNTFLKYESIKYKIIHFLYTTYNVMQYLLEFCY